MQQALIIDDNSFSVDILASFLKQEGLDGLRVTHPRNLKQVMEQLEDIRVVFLDLEMPDLDGFQVLEQLKADARFTNVPIVAHSVHISEIKVTHEAGFDGFIGKPLDGDKFPRQLARVLSGKGVWETA